MARYYRRKGRRAGNRKRKTVRKAISRVKKTNFKKNVIKVLREQIETKEAYHTNSSAALVKYNSGINSVADITNGIILPTLAKGTNDNERIGEKVRALRLNVRGYLKFDYNTSAAAPASSVGVRMMVVSVKGRDSYDMATINGNALFSLLKKGGTSTAFTGILSDLTAPINRDLFTVHHDKLIYLKQDMVFQTGTPTNSWVTSDVSKLIRFFNLNVKCRNKELKYEDATNSGLYPTNFFPFLIVGYAYLDGSAADTVSTKLGLEYTTTLKYEDA